MMILSVTLVLLAFLGESLSYRFVCYYGSWAVYRHGPGKFQEENIDPNVCTHLIFTFGGIDYDGRVKALDAWNDIGDDWKVGAFTKLQKLKAVNPKLKLIYAVGGWNEGSEKYSRVMGDPSLRRNFVQSALNFTRTHKFDGLDLDWEYPAFRGGKPGDKENFSIVVRELAEVFGPYGLLVSAAVSANALNIAASYDCPAISKYLDFINVMTYDLHGAWDGVTGHHTALYPNPKDKPSEQHLNVNNAIKAWLQCGTTPGKINLGVASYGRTFTLADRNNNEIGAPTTGPGPAGAYVPETGFLGFHELCYEMKQNLWTRFYEKNQHVPYAVKSNIWVGYDDTASIVKKVQLAKDLKLGGMMIWSIETDDFRGDCGFGKNPLLYAVRNALFDIASQPTTETDFPVPSSTVPVPPNVSEVTPDRPENENYDYKCKSVGQIFRHPKDCSAFFMCAYSGVGNQLRAVLMRCGNGLVFDETIKACNFQSPDCP